MQIDFFQIGEVPKTPAVISRLKAEAREHLEIGMYRQMSTWITDNDDGSWVFSACDDRPALPPKRRK